MAFVLTGADGVTRSGVVDPPQIGHPEYLALFVEVPAAVAPWLATPWRVEAGVWSPAGGLAALAAAMRARLTDKRRVVESATVMVDVGGGVTVAVDARREARASLAQAVMAGLIEAAAGGDPPDPVEWKAADGRFHVVGSVELLAMFRAVKALVAAAFAREASISAALDAAVADPATTPTALIALFDASIAAGWPAG